MTAAGSSVVVGVDGSASARAAARFAAEEAGRRHLPLCLVHVVPWPNPGAAATRYADRRWVDELRRAATVLLDETAAEVTPLLPPERTTTRVELGDPVAELVRAAASAAVLVVGARGTTGLTGLVIGSTATAAAACATCPVVVLPQEPALADADQRSVVVGVSGARRDDGVLAFAFAEAAVRGTDLVAVHAWPGTVTDPALRTPALLVDRVGAAADERRLLAEALAGHRVERPDVEVREVVAEGSTAAALIGAGRTAELLVVGRSHRHALGRLASPAHAVLHRAGCPVAVVPVPAAKGGDGS